MNEESSPKEIPYLLDVASVILSNSPASLEAPLLLTASAKLGSANPWGPTSFFY